MDYSSIHEIDPGPEHEKVMLYSDPDSGYRGIIAIHSTVPGPAVGGTRFWNYATDELARVEVPTEGLALLADPEQRAALVARFQELGFRFVTLDLEGFRSGSLNTLVSLDKIRLFKQGAPGLSS